MKPSMKHGIFLAVLAAGLYALSSPFSKLLLPFMPSTLMAGFLYLGAGLGMEAISARLWLGILFVTASCALLSFEDISSLQFNTGSLFVLLACVLLLGFVAYGLSIYYYVYAQRLLGAARTSAYYAVAPFIGAFLSLIIFREVPGVLFLAALALMVVGAWLSSGD